MCIRDRGYEPVRRSGNELWYIAPYRGERTPSFRVNVAVNRARKIQRFLSQPFSVATQFTGLEVTYDKTGHVIFPAEVRYVDLGSPDLIAGKADGAAVSYTHLHNGKSTTKNDTPNRCWNTSMAIEPF